MPSIFIPFKVKSIGVLSKSAPSDIPELVTDPIVIYASLSVINSFLSIPFPPRGILSINTCTVLLLNKNLFNLLSEIKYKAPSL